MGEAVSKARDRESQGDSLARVFGEGSQQGHRREMTWVDSQKDVQIFVDPGVGFSSEVSLNWGKEKRDVIGESPLKRGNGRRYSQKT